MMQFHFNVDVRESVVISKREAMGVYEQVTAEFFRKEEVLQSGYRKEGRKTQMKNPMRSYEQSEAIEDESWNLQNSYQLLHFYIETRNIAGVRDRYRNIYGTDSAFEDCRVIKSKLNKCIRAAIRKLKSVAVDMR
jgi:hypothetical protein